MAELFVGIGIGGRDIQSNDATHAEAGRFYPFESIGQKLVIGWKFLLCPECLGTATIEPVVCLRFHAQPDYSDGERCGGDGC